MMHAGHLVSSFLLGRQGLDRALPPQPKLGLAAVAQTVANADKPLVLERPQPTNCFACLDPFFALADTEADGANDEAR
jgi:hypothetical protein